MDEYGAIAAVSAEVAESAALVALLAKMSTLSKRTVMSYSDLPHLSFNFSFVSTPAIRRCLRFYGPNLRGCFW